MRVLRLAGVAIVVAGCGGGGDGGNGGTQPPPPVASVVISPGGAQSLQACGTRAFSAEARNAQGNPLSGRAFTWSTSDPTKVSLSANSGTQITATAVGVGSSTLTASSGGVTSNPGVTVTVNAGGASGSADVGTTAATFTPSCVTITAGGTVTWTFIAAPSHNVTFTTSNKPPQGDIATTQNTTVSRQFPTAGSYPYTCTLHGGMNGVVVVQ
jgi:plastocyanin